MGWKTKIVFLLMIYFGGFATAIYYLAPNGRMDCQAATYLGSSDNGPAGSDKPQNNTGALFKEYYDKAVASFNNMDKEELKAAFNRVMEKLKEMAKNAQNTQNTTAKVAENK